MFAVPAVFVLAAFAAQATADTFTLADIALTGAQRATVAEVIKASGLTIGQALTVADVGDAANRLAATGLYKNVRFRYVTLDRRMTVTFEIEEMDDRVPVTFDNFLWFTDDELKAAIRGRMPSFDGMVPASDGAIDTVRQALSAALAGRKLPGAVHYTPDVDLGSKRLVRHVFSVIEPAPKLCAVRFEGASGVPSRDLIDAVPGLVGSAYSGVRLGLLGSGTFTDLYRQRGFWRATIGAPAVTIDPACGGAAVVVPVTEGPPYEFEKAEWRGNAALPSSRLDALLGMKRGERANIRKLDDGLREVKKAYGRQGYVQAHADFQPPALDDSSRRATFAITVREGQQFRMGKVEFSGLTERQVRELTGKWKLKPGDVFDADYPGEFVSDHLRTLVAPTVIPAVTLRPEPGQDVLNVRIELR